MSILIICELREGELRSVSYSGCAAGKQLAGDTGSTFDILVLGKGAQAAAAALAGQGAENVLWSEADAVAEYSAEAHADAIAALAKEKGYKVIGAPATTTGKDLMPRVAGLLDAGMVSDVVGWEGDAYVRPMYAGNALAKVAVDTDVAVLTLRDTAFDGAPSDGGGSAVVEAAVAVDAGSLGGRFVSYNLTQSERPDLGEADIIVSVGRGVKDGEGVKIAEELADLLGAALGASRAVVDDGLLPNDLQVGQTGKIVAPNLYIACGMSGAIQHVAGMKDSKIIVAINKDEEAPIFEVADYGLVADYAKVMPELIEKVKTVKS